METAAIGLVGLIVGIALNEYFRRRRRIEAFGQKIFEIRLELYEKYHRKLDDSMEVAGRIIKDPNYSKEERHTIWSEVILDIAEFADSNRLYINEDITLHCFMTLIGVEEIADIEDDAEKKKTIKTLYQDVAHARQMIRKEIGLDEIDKFFRVMTKAKHKSHIIDYVNEARKKYKNEHQ